MTPSFADHVFFAFIAGVLPVLVLTQPASHGDLRGVSRPRTYALSLGLLLVPASALLTFWPLHGRGYGALGFAMPRGEWAGWGAWGAVGFCAACGAVLAGAKAVGRFREWLRPFVVESFEGPLAALLPRTRGEMAAFALIVPPAALAEELLFRAFMLPYLECVLPVWGAVAVSSAVFGLCHGYQGREGIAKTGAFGMVLALAYASTGSLLPAVAIHAGMNLTSAGLGWMFREDLASRG